MPRPATASEWEDSVGKGWQVIVREALARIVREPDSPMVLQVKEKFGGLRIYLTTYTPGADAIIAMAEAWASHTCEACGSTEGVETRTAQHADGTNGFWIKTWCAACHKRRDSNESK